MHGRTETEDTLCLKEDEIQKRTKCRREQDVVFKVQDCIKEQTKEKSVHLRSIDCVKK